MKSPLRNTLRALTLSVGIFSPFLSADTIVTGEPQYVGDFTGVTIVSNTFIDYNDLPSISNTGWQGQTWTVQNLSGDDTAVRSGNDFKDRGIGIAFGAPSYEMGVLSFDYDAQNATTDNLGLPNFVLYAINDAGSGSDVVGAGITLAENDQNFDNTDGNTATEGASAFIEGGRYDYFLIDEWNLPSDSGTFNSGSLDLTPSGTTNVIGHIFAFRSNNAGGGGVTLDNVTIVPEPSTLLLSLIGIGLAGGCGLFRRRR